MSHSLPASRAARDALVDHENSSLSELAVKVQERANKIGGGRFCDVRPGLDTSRSSMGAAPALRRRHSPDQLRPRQPPPRQPGRSNWPRACGGWRSSMSWISESPPDSPLMPMCGRLPTSGP